MLDDLPVQIHDVGLPDLSVLLLDLQAESLLQQRLVSLLYLVRQETLRSSTPEIIPSSLKLHLNLSVYNQQAGTGPSRRHIQGSKIAKRLPSVKYSLLQYSKIENFSKKKFRKNYILKKMDRVARGAGALKSHNAEKLKGWTL